MEQHGGHILVRIKGNCERTHTTLAGLDWALGTERSHLIWRREKGLGLPWQILV